MLTWLLHRIWYGQCWSLTKKYTPNAPYDTQHAFFRFIIWCLVYSQHILFQWFCFGLVLQCIIDLSTSIYMLGLGFVTSITFIFLVGVFMSSWLGASVLGLGEWFIKRMPFVRHIYNASKQISSAISPGELYRNFSSLGWNEWIRWANL